MKTPISHLPCSPFPGCRTGEEKGGKGWERAEKNKIKWNHPYFQGDTYGEVNADSYERVCVPDDSQFRGDVPDDPQSLKSKKFKDQKY